MENTQLICINRHVSMTMYQLGNVFCLAKFLNFVAKSSWLFLLEEALIKATHLCEHAQCGHVDDGFGQSELVPLK